MMKKLIAGVLASVLAFGALPTVNAPAAVSSPTAESDVWTDDGAISEKPSAGVVTLRAAILGFSTIPKVQIGNEEPTIPKVQIGRDENGNAIYGWPTGIPKKSATELAALKKLIAKAKKQGARVGEDVDDPNEYTWKNGKLVGICWKNVGLFGAWDFSSLKNLKTLRCNKSGLSKLDVSKCTKLESLYCDHNKLSKLNVSKCTKLKNLDCSWNNLSKLDVSKCTKLKSLNCSVNNLSKLNVGKCTKLKSLSCGKNNLSKLDVSKCRNLEKLSCYKNNLSKLDVSKCTKLGSINCSANKLSKLDVSKCKNLWAVRVDEEVTLIRK